MTRAIPFEPYQLTPFDHLFSVFYGGCALSFRVSCPDDAVPTLCAGLDRLVSHLPFLTGQVIQKGKRMEVHSLPPTTRGSSPPLYVVRHFPNLRLPSKPKCRSQFCGDYIRDESLILAPRGLCSLAGTPIVRFQINVLADGIILVLWVNHMAIDGTGVGKMIEALSICCQAEVNPGTARQLPTAPAAEAATRAILADFWTSPSSTITETETETDGPPALGEDEHHDSSLVDVDFCFSASKVQRLRDCVRGLLRDNKGGGQTILDISCDDIVTAFLWISLSRVRRRSLKDGQNTITSNLTRAVDVRKRLNNPVPDTYLGNCVVLPKETLPLEELDWRNPGPDNDDQHLCRLLAPLLSQVAGILRARLHTVNDQYIRGTFSPSSHSDSGPGPHVFVSSIRHMKVYEHDFGPFLGHPEGIDLLPYMRPDAVCTIKPKRADGDWDIGVTLNREDITLLTADPWFGWISEKASPFRVFESV
ncbi:uncharacterized protein CDV56_104387 [Aspergillus thermomutatus]|uniref:Uncharacterized protein n=1 Tax=Aspergillus thermomutatus TaxID=41047 RepID=A0A397GL71_ASPTH|nr:uncharacterized protein CDV56_104387 [Aspergillus thermomutatus]RHZ50989.1 hypothetical protein CDV56_104387 [Aspergillus thermomutatus]